MVHTAGRKGGAIPEAGTTGSPSLAGQPVFES